MAFKKLAPLTPNPLLESPRIITDAERETALGYLKKKFEGEDLEQLIDMLGLNGRPLRDTFKGKPGAAEKWQRRARPTS